MRKKIYFLAPRNQGGAYSYYKGISEYLHNKHGGEAEIYFCNSFFSYIKLHFMKADYIFSIIPFFFKPVGAKKYIFNLHGNFKIERKNKGLGVKLLYLSELNLWFSDTILLTSYYLSDVLDFREKYDNKILIIPNFTFRILSKNQQLESNKYNFLTITSFTFKEKTEGLKNLSQVIQKLGRELTNEKIKFTIIGGDDSKNYKYIRAYFDNINFSGNIEIVWKKWLSQEQLEIEFLQHNTFLYWSGLDNTPGVVLEAMSYGLSVYTNNFPSFKYFLSDSIICKSEDEMVEKMLKNNNTVNNYKFRYIDEVGEEIWKNIDKG